MNLIPLPALDDNYIWLLHDAQRALVVDPGDAEVVRQALQANALRLDGILVTHHHPDHTDGVVALQQQFNVPVFGPATESLPGEVRRLDDGDAIQLLGLGFETLLVPGHTAGHIAFYTTPQGQAPILFCGDTLFSAGCGRLFEGTPAQMLASLDRLAALPGDTRVACTHEYTLSNLKFALAVEPDNAALQAYTMHCQNLRHKGVPTLPTTLTTELEINPFLRSRTANVRKSVLQQAPSSANDVDFFAALREWKNNFR
jgi:hydroxyacylglutathione hydrolase